MSRSLSRADVADRPSGASTCVAITPASWRDPVEVASAFADEAYACVLLSTGDAWSYVLRRPDRIARPEGEVGGALDVMALQGACDPDGPPFQGGVVGLASYELSARLEPTSPQARDADWPDLELLRYGALLAFHAESRRVLAIGRGSTQGAAETRSQAALRWLDLAPAVHAAPGRLTRTLECITPDRRHADAVADAVRRIGTGEIFQANLARPWRGTLDEDATPFDLFRRLSGRSLAGYAAYLRLPGRALVSNSPERFLSATPAEGATWVESHPIKGTRPRDADPARDAALAAELKASAKDHAENLMIVDLMRNDLARVCTPGTVSVPELAALHSYANVHHLVSRVRGRLRAGATAWDAFLAAFPPGSVTGAPKLQAMQVIARHEPPRGPYCGSLFWVGADGAMDASVLIRTAAFVHDGVTWRFEARAGGGVVADSDPVAEVAETTAKIAAIVAALQGTG